MILFMFIKLDLTACSIFAVQYLKARDWIPWYNVFTSKNWKVSGTRINVITQVKALQKKRTIYTIFNNIHFQYQKTAKVVVARSTLCSSILHNVLRITTTSAILFQSYYIHYKLGTKSHHFLKVFLHINIKPKHKSLQPLSKQ